MGTPELVIDPDDFKWGKYVEREVFKFTPEFEARWEQWLDDHFDPGNYDGWKDREQEWSDYIGGRPKFWSQTFLPAHMVQEFVLAVVS